MKYIVFSFDDGRKDFYTNALAILRKYKQTGVVNVIGDYIGSHAPVGFLSSGNEFMNIEELKIAYEYGIEIGNHSMNHSNELGAIKNFKINDDTINGGGYGFASPGSEICKNNFSSYKSLVDEGEVIYIRSGRQIKRDGYIHAALYLVLKKIKSPFLFWLYQRRNIVHLNMEYDFYPSLAVDSFTTSDEIKYFISRMKDEQALILMFHSVLKKSDKGYGKDKWFNDIDMFDEICRFCAQNNSVQVITNRHLCEMQRNRKSK